MCFSPRGACFCFWVFGARQSSPVVTLLHALFLGLACTPALAHTFSLDTDLTRNTRAPHFTPQHWLLCHMGLY